MKILTIRHTQEIQGGLEFEQPASISCKCWTALEVIDTLYKQEQIDYNTSVKTAFAFCNIFELITYQSKLAVPTSEK